MKMRFYFLSTFIIGALLFVAQGVFAAGWVQSTSGTTLDLYDVDFSGSFGVVTANGSSVLVTHDDGKTWATLTVGFGSYFGVKVIDASTAIIVGTSGKIYKTTDAGITWVLKTSGTTVTLRSIDMISSTVGLVVADGGRIYKTTNGGDAWVLQTSNTTSTLNDVDMFSSSIAYAVGNSGTILKTTNGGTTWTALSSGTTASLTSVDVVSATEIWASGSDGRIYKSTNSGTTWTSAAISGVTYFKSIDLDATMRGIVTSGSRLYETSDGGTTWTSVTFPTSVPSNLVLNQVWFKTDVNHRRAVGYSGVILRYDGVAPSPVEDLMITTGVADNTPTLTWFASTDQESAVSFEMSLDSGAYVNIGSANTKTLDSLANGSHLVSMRSVDEAMNIGGVQSVSFTIDANGPTVGLVTPVVATINQPVTLQVIPSDTSGVASCSLYVNGVLQGAMSVSAGTYSRSHTFTSSGNASVHATCVDTLGNTASGTDVTVAVSAGPDTTSPTVSGLTPNTATAGTAVTLSATVSDNNTVSSCQLFVAGVNQGGMSVMGGTSSIAFTFSAAGSYATYAQCSDAAGNTGTGISTTITVSAAASSGSGSSGSSSSGSSGSNTNPAPANSNATSGNLIKTACVGLVDVNDPCKAVYYSGSDGKRHAFTNEKVYFTWYSDFNGIVTISKTEMAAIPLGKNVTYRPGIRMLKFISVPTVYAVSHAGLLRPIASETIAKELYGSNWNKQIDDVADTFYKNYSIGSSITNAMDFNRTAEAALSVSINQNL